MTDPITKALDAGQRVVDLLPNQWFETFVDPRELRVVLPAAREELARVQAESKELFDDNIDLSKRVVFRCAQVQMLEQELDRLRSELAAARHVDEDAEENIRGEIWAAILKYKDNLNRDIGKGISEASQAIAKEYFASAARAPMDWPATAKIDGVKWVRADHLRPAPLPSETAIAQAITVEIYGEKDCTPTSAWHAARAVLHLLATAPSADAGESPARAGKDDVQDAINERLKHWRPEPSAEAIRAEEREAVLRDLNATVAEDAAGHEGEVWIIERAKARIRARSTAKGGE